MKGELYVRPDGVLAEWAPAAPGALTVPPSAPAPARGFNPAANLKSPRKPRRTRLILGLLAEGRSYGEIALALGVTRGVVAGVRHRAKKRGRA